MDPATRSICRPDGIRPGIAGLFDVLHGMYGAKFADAWRGTDPAIMRAVWVEHLKDYTGGEIARAIEACKSLKWPPTLPEFLMLARPPVDYEDSFLEAVEQMRLRESGHDEWRRPAVYWAARVIGTDLQAMPYKYIAARWRRALDSCLRDYAAGLLGPVPPRPLALPDQRKPAPMPEAVRELAARLHAQQSQHAAEMEESHAAG